MQKHQRLADNSRLSRRTIADVVDVLRQGANFMANDTAMVIIGGMKLPSEEIVGTVQVLFSAPDGTTYVVALPTSRWFLARDETSQERQKLDICKLDRAIVDGDGNVVLQDGARLRAVEVMPHRLPLDPSDTDWRIVHLTITAVGAEAQCYRLISSNVTRDQFRNRMNLKRLRQLRRSLPRRRVLDFRKLNGLELPPLKELAYRLYELDPTLDISQQKIADALRDFGIRIPRQRSTRSARAAQQLPRSAV